MTAVFATDQDDSSIVANSMVEQQKSKQGTSLPTYFYQSDVIYKRELKKLFFNSWIYAGHISEIPNSGDYFLCDVGNDSAIICRHEDNSIHSFLNVCRHRGARVAEEQCGNKKAFVCPYHGWAYDTNGTLKRAREMEALENFSCDHYPLKPVSHTIFHGMIFINFNADAPDLGKHLAQLEPSLGPYRLENAKIADRETYTVGANWKFVIENYLECYHCATSHRQYAKIHTLREKWENVKQRVEEVHKNSPAITGLGSAFCETVSKEYTDAEAFGCDIWHDRYGLYEGYLTGSKDGQPVAPLMGDIGGYDGGAGDFQIGPFTFMLNYCDHAVLYRFIPRGQHKTDMDVVWFVNGDAEEGKDYNKAELTALWHDTTMEDAYIISRNAEGALSDFYEPGPLHPEFEELQMKFLQWYLDNMSA
ncbi:aromatic ring-hydroxylating dioxygenase subunit alpha [Dasania sp. GY-MA-18]|uniref:Aromatic ring-hydroxylating dioxygenase subunit alpha n=1 Tax=Dasania phycosphaerae TaxID=2950436 RepID=A0A9J6RNQ4_9GAMM|nr:MULTISPECIES: aromatic ring-hydroxylating dioxygenase subunit alpha [Dasania]MCR8923536.1 aromatic ring-hydroxylating dioxygenase subunit alpha [Dasania sp. GY-MA-18]MCZ0865970.1 aromatic ring-hydroxylating dioxygenase subunit alpha [Dasania phycosphaerae]MCZ0869694.1 aromatic ring-hydroxylating dioxygenase subunit alpha [Dasania phycosphaerae]